MKTCSKCKVRNKDIAEVIEGGELYHFCLLCMGILEKNGTNMLHIFMQDREIDDNYPMQMHFIERNMLKARLARVAGKRLWAVK